MFEHRRGLATTANEVQVMVAKKSKSKKKWDRVWERKNEDGTTSYKGVVRVRPFDTATKVFSDGAEAAEWAAKLVNELKAKRKSGEVRKDLTSLTIKGLIEEYLDDHETKKLKTFDDIERLLGWWVNHFGAEKILETGPVKLREARALLQKGGRAEGTCNRYLGALRSAWSWGKAAGLIPADRFWPTRLFLSEPRERVRYLNDGELKAVLAEAEKNSPWMSAAIVTSICTGLRQGELLRLEAKDINFTKQTLTVHISKTGKRRLVHLEAPAIDALKKIRGVGSKRVFVQSDGSPIDKSRLRVQWLKVRAAAKLEDFHWHDLRHSCASFLAQGGASLPEIGHVLGHSSPSITAKYAHLIEGAAVTGSAALAAKILGAKL
jgi:integrase